MAVLILPAENLVAEEMLYAQYPDLIVDLPPRRTWQQNCGRPPSLRQAHVFNSLQPVEYSRQFVEPFVPSLIVSIKQTWS